MRVEAWVPLLVVGLAVPLVFAYAAANPLPANGYGHSVYDVHDTITIPAGSSETIVIGGRTTVPRGSLVFVTAGVMNRQPGSDLHETAYFRLAHGEAVLEEGVMSPLSHSFETRFDSSGSGNPQIFVRNDHDFDLLVDYRAFVIRPPTTMEHFALYLTLLAPALAVAGLWLGFSFARERRAGQAG